MHKSVALMEGGLVMCELNEIMSEVSEPVAVSVSDATVTC